MRNGVDIVEISRFCNMKNFDRFKKYAFTKREIKYIENKKNPYPSAAALFAAKEAFSKYMGSGFRGFGLKDIEVLHDDMGAPYLLFMGKRCDACLSLSHSKEYAVATVCGDGENLVFGKYNDLIKSYASMMPKRAEDAHKGNCGKVVIAAGSDNMSGAACLAAKGALKSGAGIVYLAIPESARPFAAAKLTEVITYPLSCHDGFADIGAAKDIKTLTEKANAIAIGPGMGKTDGTYQVLKHFFELASKGVPCVVDADGINVLAENTGLFDILKSSKEYKGNLILTPHPVEMERLCGNKVQNDKQGRITVATDFAKKHNVVVLLKGKDTVVASPVGNFHINESGNKGMATGGMGDVLTGVIASLCGQGAAPYNAAVLGGFLHGLAGDISAKDKGICGLTAGDVAESLPYAVKYIMGE